MGFILESTPVPSFKDASPSQSHQLRENRTTGIRVTTGVSTGALLGGKACGYKSYPHLFASDSSPQPQGRTHSTHVHLPRITYFANNKDVGEPGGKAIAIGILHVNHIE